MALTVAGLLDRLTVLRTALDSERTRIEATYIVDRARIVAQLAAINAAISALQVPAKAAVVDTLFDTLDTAGVVLEINT
jgi:hypothetical protein